MNEPAAPTQPAGEIAPADAPNAAKPFRPLRVWPALFLVALMIAARYGPAFLEGGKGVYWMITVFGPMLCGLLVIVWWLTASRATWKERLFGFLGIIASLGVVLLLADPTMRGPGTNYLTGPMGIIAFALGAAALRQQRPVKRTGLAVLAALVGFGFSLLLRNEGMTGDYELGAHWRWKQSSEALLMAQRAANPGKPPGDAGAAAPSIDVSNPEWPGFRGADRAARAHGAAISTDWAAHPPRQLWKVPVGPAWSSFAVAGKFLFTQEQRGPLETIVCYGADTGREVWSQPIEGRLEDPLGGPGPRATPALAAGGLFATCATGSLLRLNPSTGEIAWEQDLKIVAGRALPMWGFSASPLIVDNVVIVYAGGPGDKGLLAFEADSGALRWSVAAGNDSYSSPQLSTIAGENLILMLTNEGLVLVDPATGKTRLNYEWKCSYYRALQPQVVGTDTILLPSDMSTGARAIRVANTDGQLAATELWTSKNLKPDFTDLVTFQGFAYGNDAGMLTCIDLKNGERQWKGGRYGKGQILLLEDSGLLLIAAEDGRVVLLRADPKQHTELASFKALEGKTWNHPVLVGDRLYARNSQEAACFQLPLAETKTAAAGADSKSPAEPSR